MAERFTGGKHDWRDISYFIKFFKEERFADQFMKGSLYLNRLSYFENIDDNDDGRADATETVYMWFQPSGVIMKLNVPGVGSVEITKADLAAPLSMSSEIHTHLHVLCLYAVYTTGFDDINIMSGNLPVPESEVPRLLKKLKIDERCLKFGSCAVITPAVPFPC